MLYLERMSGSLANYFNHELYGRVLFMWFRNISANGNVSTASDDL